MTIPPLPPCHELVRLHRDTLDKTVEAVLSHLRRKPVGWSYNLARHLSPLALPEGLPISAFRRACGAARMAEAGKAANLEVLEEVRRIGIGRDLQCYTKGDAYLSITKEISLRVAADFYYVEGGVAKLVWLQPRRTYALDDKQLGTFCTLLRRALLVGDFVDADVELFDLSAPPRSPRNPRVMSVRELPQVSEDQATAVVGRVLSAYQTIKEMELDWSHRRSAKREKTSAQTEMSV